jgi:hypothetical protein
MGNVKKSRSSPRQQLLGKLTAAASNLLLNRTVTAVTYGPVPDFDDWGDMLQVEFNDGSVLFSSADPEGNGPGALFLAESRHPDARQFCLVGAVQ